MEKNKILEDNIFKWHQLKEENEQKQQLNFFNYLNESYYDLADDQKKEAHIFWRKVSKLQVKEIQKKLRMSGRAYYEELERLRVPKIKKYKNTDSDSYKTHLPKKQDNVAAESSLNKVIPESLSFSGIYTASELKSKLDRISATIDDNVKGYKLDCNIVEIL